MVMRNNILHARNRRRSHLSQLKEDLKTLLLGYKCALIVIGMLLIIWSPLFIAPHLFAHKEPECYYIYVCLAATAVAVVSLGATVNYRRIYE